MCLPGDANQDGEVNIGDLTALASHWQQTGQGLVPGDFNGDGQVDIGDLTALASNWQTDLAVGPADRGIVPGRCSVGGGRRCADSRKHRGGCAEPSRRDRRRCGR